MEQSKRRRKTFGKSEEEKRAESIEKIIAKKLPWMEADFKTLVIQYTANHPKWRDTFDELMLDMNTFIKWADEAEEIRLKR